MKNQEIEKLEKQLVEIKKARKDNSISVNEYCDMYYCISQKIKQLSR